MSAKISNAPQMRIMAKPATDYGGKSTTHNAANPPPVMVQNRHPQNTAAG
jgi:hypothetical protein